jgi:hypothetical protein
VEVLGGAVIILLLMVASCLPLTIDILHYDSKMVISDFLKENNHSGKEL